MTLSLRTEFDYIILSDLVNDLWDVQRVFEQIAGACSPSTRIIINTYSRLWELPLAAARRVGLAAHVTGPNWLTTEDLENLLYLAGFELIRSWQEILCPVRVPGIDALCNRYLVKIPPFGFAALANFMIARPAVRQPAPLADSEPLVSVIVPARNEAGNVEQVFQRVPEMGMGTEIVFVEGHSRDDTWGAIERAMAKYPERRCKLLRQTGEGKGDAVRLGFASAEGDLLMILDADLTVAPEDLPRFYAALRSGVAEFANGVRLVYPMEGRAMRLSQSGRKQVVQLGLLLADRSEDQGHSVRDEGSQPQSLPGDCGESAILRRLRSLRRLRPYLRRNPAEPQTGRHTNPLPGSYLRTNQYPALEARLGADKNVDLRVQAAQIHLNHRLLAIALVTRLWRLLQSQGPGRL